MNNFLLGCAAGAGFVLIALALFFAYASIRVAARYDALARDYNNRKQDKYHGTEQPRHPYAHDH